MQPLLVFVPISADDAPRAASGTLAGPLTAYAVTRELVGALGYGDDMAEDAEYAALVLASVAGLTRHGQRLVLVADVAPDLVSAGDDPANGEVRLARLEPRWIVSWFTDEPSVDVTDAAAAAAGLDLDTAWDAAAVQELVASHELLWHGPAELAALGED